MINIQSILSAALLLSSLPALAAQPQAIQPGQWEITMKTMMSASTPTSTMTVCITKEQAEAVAVPKSKSKDDCQVSTGSLNGNQLKYQVKCGRKKTSSDVEITFSGDHYEGTVTQNYDGVEIKQVITARRLGECPASDE